MAKAGKKYNEAKAKIDVLKKYPIEEAVNLLKEVSYSKFG
jgi:ribosomal protein L1